MWSLPIAIATGNTLILKPSEKVPLTMNRVVALLKEAGIPDGVVNLVNGTVDGKNLSNHLFYGIVNLLLNKKKKFRI